MVIWSALLKAPARVGRRRTSSGHGVEHNSVRVPIFPLIWSDDISSLTWRRPKTREIALDVIPKVAWLRSKKSPIPQRMFTSLREIPGSHTRSAPKWTPPHHSIYHSKPTKLRTAKSLMRVNSDDEDSQTEEVVSPLNKKGRLGEGDDNFDDGIKPDEATLCRLQLEGDDFDLVVLWNIKVVFSIYCSRISFCYEGEFFVLRENGPRQRARALATPTKRRPFFLSLNRRP